MSYFLIYRLERGIKIKNFSEDGLIEHLGSYFSDHEVEFLNTIPKDIEEIRHNQAIVICGEVTRPKPVTIVKTYSLR